MSDTIFDKDAVIKVLNKMLEAGRAGVICYTHTAITTK